MLFSLRRLPQVAVEESRSLGDFVVSEGPSKKKRKADK
jgi:hypothetical protein